MLKVCSNCVHKNVMCATCDFVPEIEHTEECTKYGEWIETYDEMVCSKCHMPPITKEEENGKIEILTKYCPNCGADMRGEKK